MTSDVASEPVIVGGLYWPGDRTKLLAVLTEHEEDAAGELAAWVTTTRVPGSDPYWRRACRAIADRVDALIVDLEAQKSDEPLDEYPWTPDDIEAFVDAFSQGRGEVPVFDGADEYGDGTHYTEWRDGTWRAWQEHPRCKGWWRKVDAEDSGRSFGDESTQKDLEEYAQALADGKTPPGAREPSQRPPPAVPLAEEPVEAQAAGILLVATCPNCGLELGAGDTVVGDPAEHFECPRDVIDARNEKIAKDGQAGGRFQVPEWGSINTKCLEVDCPASPRWIWANSPQRCPQHPTGSVMAWPHAETTSPPAVHPYRELFREHGQAAWIVSKRPEGWAAPCGICGDPVTGSEMFTLPGLVLYAHGHCVEPECGDCRSPILIGQGLQSTDNGQHAHHTCQIRDDF